MLAVVREPFHQRLQVLPRHAGRDAAGTAQEQALLRAALDRARFNQRKAALLLNLSYDQFRGLIRKYGGVEKL